MRDIAAVFPRLHVGQGSLGPFGVAFGEDVGGLVHHPYKTGAGGVGLRPYHVTDRIESGFGPGVNKGVKLAVAVKRDAERVRFEDAIEFRVYADDSGRIIVVRQCSA